jgi:hypothetical protein
MYKYLVTFDADRIHDYVFTTGRLKEIIGGSYIVDSFTEVDVKKIIEENEGEDIYSAGGAGKVLFKEYEQAKNFMNSIRAKYHERTIISYLSAACAEIIDEKFKEAAKEADRRLRQAKDDKREVRQLTNHPLMEFCNSCGVYPVAGQMDERNLCQSCINKREKAKELQDHANKILEDFKKNKASLTDFWGIFLSKLDSEKFYSDWHLGFGVIDEMDDFRSISSPEGYVGFIYTDGDNMGRLFGSLEREDHYKIFSKAVREGTKKAIAHALARHLDTTVKLKKKDGDKDCVQFFPVLIGGDDVIVITASHKALEVAVDYCRLFNSYVRKIVEDEAEKSNICECEKKELIDKSKDVSSSAGIVLAHTSHPIISMLKRAEELLRSAKLVGGGVDFLVSSSPTLLPLSNIRSNEYIFGETSDKVICTARPYTFEEMDYIIKSARKFKENNFPKTKLNALYSAMFQPPMQARFDSLLVRSRLTESERSMLNDFVKDDDFPYESTEWDETDAPKKKSRLADLVEIYDFIKI